MRPKAKWQIAVLVLLAGLVFLFALNAKLSLYDQPLHPTGLNSSKMWLNSQKMELQAPTLLLLPLLSVALLFLAPRLHRTPWPKPHLEVALPTLFSAHGLRRFLRPPPVL